MRNQLSVSFFKIRHSWFIYFAVVGMASLAVYYGYCKLAGLGFGLYEAFTDTICDTSLMFLLALVSAWFIGNDFSNRTIHHEITLGYSRLSILVVRELAAYLFAVVLHFTYIIFTMLGLGIKTGVFTCVFEKQDLFWCLAVSIQLIAMQSMIVLITILCAKATSAIAASVLFMIITCNLLRNFVVDEGAIFTKSVFCLAYNNTSENLSQISLVAVLTWLIVLVLTYVVFRKKDIE